MKVEQLLVLQLESSENWSVGYTKLNFGLDACSSQRWADIQNPWKSQTIETKYIDSVWVFKDWSKSGSGLLPTRQLKDVCHPGSSPNSMYNRFLQTRGRARWKRLKTLPNQPWDGWCWPKPIKEIKTGLPLSDHFISFQHIWTIFSWMVQQDWMVGLK